MFWWITSDSCKILDKLLKMIVAVVVDENKLKYIFSFAE
jgi:hypothetical protein